jgi:sec-independent protein translocase protein TatA
VSIGPAEIIIVLILALLVFGPKRLPQMGKSLGKGVREFRKAAETAKTELGLGEITDQINEVKSTFTEPIQGITGTFGDLKSSVDLKGAIEAPVAASAVVAGAPASASPAADSSAPATGTFDPGPETPAVTPQTVFTDVPRAPATPAQPVAEAPAEESAAPAEESAAPAEEATAPAEELEAPSEELEAPAGPVAAGSSAGPATGA